MKASEICSAVGGTLVGEDRSFDGVAPATTAGPQHLAYVLGGQPCRAGVLIATAARESQTTIVVESPRLAFANALRVLFPPPAPMGVDPRAYVHPTASLGTDVSIYAGAYVGENTVIGDRVQIHPNAVVYGNVTIDSDTIIQAGAVLGVAGFAYEPNKDRPQEVPQIGGLNVGKRVVIGANSSVARGAIADTTIGDDCKIDDLVLVGHNSQLGKAVMLAGQTGLAGSTVIGDGALLGGQVGTADHVQIGAGARLGAGSGVHRDIEAHEVMLGRPAKPIRQTRRIWALLSHLPDLFIDVRKLHQRLSAIEDAMNTDHS